MGERSQIEWTDATWNPVRGCTKISPGCKNCYAEVFSERFRGVVGHPFEHGFDLRLVPEKLLEPFRWARSRRIFVNSMSDLFHDAVPDTYILDVFAVMQKADWHTYQVLTKRPDRMRRVANGLPWLRSATHVWLGTSVENVRHGLPRISELTQTDARVRFLSIEPLLEDLGAVELANIDWVIVGGESGAGARPMQESWVNNIRAQCRQTGVPFFFKQWGGVHKSRAGRLLGGRTYDEMPSLPLPSSPPREIRQRRELLLQLRHGVA